VIEPPGAAAPAGDDHAIHGRAARTAGPTLQAAKVETGGDTARGEPTGPQTLRVGVDLLENLMTLVSELVLTRNQLLQMVRNGADSAFKAPLQRLSHITSELQEGVMKTRMQPIGNAWSKLPRLVRDLGVDLGKRIELKMIGAETELDRQVLELIKDPLTHMVRNSADHGLESLEARRAAGKPEHGTITLNAYHEGGHIIIEISDDGRGLDVDAIGRKAVASGLVTETELAGLSPNQIQQFIFRPGFSTASQVTSVSGRGVGMDVVRTNIEKIGGTIELTSEPGRGTRFTIKIPLTLAIVSALIVAIRGERFAIPQLGVVELVRAGAQTEHRIEVVDGAPILRLRDRLLPLMSLRQLLGMPEESDTRKGDAVYVVVSKVGARMFGVIVDQVFDTEEIVVKPLAPIIRGHRLFSGNTILGDGGVVMILDPNGLAGALADGGARSTSEAQGRQVGAIAETTSLLLFRAGDSTPKAVPLALVTRLEGIAAASVERSGHTTVVQYRGRLMPLVGFDTGPVLTDRAEFPVLVFADQDRTMGLAVDEIIDIIEEEVVLERQSSGGPVLGSAILAGKATEVVDVGYFVNHVFGGWFDSAEKRPFDAGQTAVPRRLLLVDDSAFFRNVLAPILRSNGYDVVTAADPSAALALRDRGEMFDVIVSDIEMPGMNGFEFVAACREGGPWRHLPIVAVTSHDTPQDVEKAREAGFDQHVGKLDRDALLDALTRLQMHVREAA
jgi:two-component system chemotaxis sensor kinase CheA